MSRGATVKTEFANGYTIERRMITRRHELAFERQRCLGCDLCVATCPQQAISLVPAAVRDGQLNERPAIEIDPERCVFCGECSVLCPTHALHLYVDGEERIPVIDMGAFPRLEQGITIDTSTCQVGCGLACEVVCRMDAITVRIQRNDEGKITAITEVAVDEDHCTYCSRCQAVCPAGAIRVRKPWRGRIQLLAERCPAGCHACADLCPSGALIWQKDQVQLDEHSCTYCGACRTLCPSEGALTVVRSGVEHTPVRSGAWFEALQKLVSVEALAQELDAAVQARRRQVLSYLPNAKRS